MGGEFELKDFLDLINETEIKKKMDTLNQTLRGLVTEAVKKNETKIAKRLWTKDHKKNDETIDSSIEIFLDKNYKQIFSEKDYDTTLLLNDQCVEHSYIGSNRNDDPSEYKYTTCKLLDCDGQTSTKCTEFSETTNLRTKLNEEIEKYHTDIVNIRGRAKREAKEIFKKNLKLAKEMEVKARIKKFIHASKIRDLAKQKKFRLSSLRIKLPRTKYNQLNESKLTISESDENEITNSVNLEFRDSDVEKGKKLILYHHYDTEELPYDSYKLENTLKSRWRRWTPFEQRIRDNMNISAHGRKNRKGKRGKKASAKGKKRSGSRSSRNRRKSKKNN